MSKTSGRTQTKTPTKTPTKRPPTGKKGRATPPRDRGRAAPAVATARRRSRGPRRSTIIAAAVVTAIAVGVLYLVYQSSSSQGTPDASAGESGYNHVAGEPGIGDTAPDFSLASHTGGSVSLADFQGESVLLYFQEGLMCQPCWDQITDLEQNQAALTEAGIDKVVSITSDSADQIAQKMADMNLSTPTLSDPNLEVIRAYDANSYGMMGDTRAGHSFILVGPDGAIQWRADYGGAPDYTMYLPTHKMLADLAKERSGARAG